MTERNPPTGSDAVVFPPIPRDAGYGGEGWVSVPRRFGRLLRGLPPIIGGGYGGDPYGLGSYGSIDTIPPYLTKAISITGYEIEVYFSEEMDTTNPALLDPASYTISEVLGAPATVLGVTIGQMGTVGAKTVILLHTGTTQGGTYTVVANGPTDLSGNPVLIAPVSLLARGEPPAYTVTPLSGNELLFTFDHPMLPASAEPPGGHGILDTMSYGFTSTPVYPIPLTPVSVAHPYLGDLSKVYMKVTGMTSLLYTSNISPATAFTYDGSILPSAAPNFQGVELYPGNGTSVIVSGHLALSRSAGLSYGWAFKDTSGIVVPGTSTIRIDLQFNAAGTVYTPPLSSFVTPQVGQFIIEDGPLGSGVQVKITLQKGFGDISQIRIQSGTYDVTQDVAWDVGTNTISLVRNIKAGIYTILFNEAPLVATAIANFTQSAQGTGAEVTWTFFNEAYAISGFLIYAVNYKATSTVFSGAWNFLHNVLSNFVGSSALAQSFILTQHGPLVKDWGDTTPATKNDVAVRVAGIPVTVGDVNPYVGKIYPTYPIPLFDPLDPMADVKVDYYWFCSPVMEFSGLNTEGLVLNKWDQAVGHHDPADHGSQIQDALHPKGAPDIARFQIALGLAPVIRPSPLLIGWRWMGFEREYSALLNSPATMRLNQNPWVDEVPGFEQIPAGQTAAFEGLAVPTVDDPPWLLLGDDAGHVDVNQGTYTLIDDQSGPYDPADFRVATYYRNVYLSFPSSIYVVGRFIVENTTPDGVFTGVGFGTHDDHHLYLVGALLVNSLQHVGMLLDARQPQLAGSWDIGPKDTATLLDQSTMKVLTAVAPMGFKTGSRFQILSGTQTGVYTAQSVTRNCDGTTVATVSPAFPVNVRLYGNNYPTVYYETPWTDKPTTYRLVVNPDLKAATLSLSGLTTVQVLSWDGTTALPSPADLPQSIMLPTAGAGEGVVWWGSLSTWATNQTKWSFLRYGISPDETAIRGHFKTVLTEMNVPSEDNPTYEWFFGQTFGYTKISSPATLLLKKTSASDTLNFGSYYQRIEPFFTRDANVDLRAKFRTDSATLGAEDTEIVLNDGLREVRLSTLMYVERPGNVNFRQIISMPSESMAGVLDPVEQDWEYLAGGGTKRVHESDLWLTQDAGQSIRYRAKLDLTSVLPTDMNGEIIEARLATQSYVGKADGTTGIQFSGDIGTLHHVGVRLRGGATPAAQLIDMLGNLVQEYPFDWTDGALHSYRAVATVAGGVSLFLDDTLQIPTVAIAPFLGNTGLQAGIFGATNLIGGIPEPVQSVVYWRSVSYTALPSVAVHRTLGVWKGGDVLLLNNWEIPRTDTSTAPNSAEIGPVVEDMDWQSPIEVRVLRTPDWGVTVYRTDLPPPPYYIPETPGVAGTGFLTQTTEPSAGWINVEYPQLPRVSSAFGFLAFGTLEKRAISQQRWNWVRYNLFRPPTSDIQAPQNMVLNYGNVITSGELTDDVTPESVIIQTLDKTRMTLIPTHLFADAVIKIIDGTTVFTYEMWTFDRDSQTVTLQPDANGTPREFSSDHAAVTVIFNPGKPVTNTYLQGQPLLDSITKLNEGTPPVPMSQQMIPGQEVFFGTGLDDPNATLNTLGGTTTEQYMVVTFRRDPDFIYEKLDFMPVTDGGDVGYISFPCECGQEFELSGDLFWEFFQTPQPDDFDQSEGFLFASGGGFVDGLIGPGSALLYPNWPSDKVRRGTEGGKVALRTEWALNSQIDEPLAPPVDDLTEFILTP